MLNPIAMEMLYEHERRLRAVGPRPLTTRQEIARLRRIPLFSGLPRRTLRMVLRLSGRVRFPAGRTLVGECERSQQVIVLAEGAALEKAADGPERILSPGDHVGAVELVEGACARATVRTLTEAELLILSRREAVGLLAAAPRLAERLIGERPEPLPDREVRLDAPRGSLAG